MRLIESSTADRLPYLPIWYKKRYPILFDLSSHVPENAEDYVADNVFYP